MGAIDNAYAMAEAALATSLPNRWRHVKGVASLAEFVGKKLTQVDGDALVEAAWLHDIGYSPEIARTGFHPLDGARYLQTKNVDLRIVSLVAHHSAASIEARIRGVTDLNGYADEATPTRDALWYCDASTGPHGERWSAQQRWLEVRRRYGPQHVVSQFLDEAEPLLRASIDRVDTMMRED